MVYDLEIRVEDQLKQFDACLANEPAFCTAKCPFHLDVRTFTELIEQGQINSAYKLYRDAVGFPHIVSRLCDRPCEQVCPLRNAGGPIALRELEAMVTAKTTDREPNDYNLQARPKRIAVIGAGLSGLGCALRLASKKYSVEIFERDPSIGGDLDEAMLADVERQFMHEHYLLHTNTEITSREEINRLGFDAAYVATGALGNDLGLSRCLIDTAPYTDAAGGGNNPLGEAEEIAGNRHGLSDLSAGVGIGWFAGGAVTGQTGVDALAQGLHAGAVIDAFLRTGNLVYPENIMETKLPPDPKRLVRQTVPSGEASRCLKCRCDACMEYCDVPAYYKKWPQRIRDEVLATTMPGRSEVKATPAKRLLNAADISGVLKNVCPVRIDLDALLLAGRQSMHRQKKMPWAFHDFHLRDMAHADGETAALVLPAKNASPGLAFFPGCQLGASAPSLVIAAYEKLRELDAKGAINLSGLILRCCGAPAEWSGDTELFRSKLDAILSDLHALGDPALIMTCPTCAQKFARYLPEVRTLSLYEIFADAGVVPTMPQDDGGGGGNALSHWAIFDPCSVSGAKNETKVKAGVRKLARGAGAQLFPLPVQGSVARCCGFGGQPDLANPDFAEYVAKARAAETDLPYITYCINCRDAFAAAGKQTAHILELLFPKAADKTRPDATGRRENREYLKRYFQGDPVSKPSYPFTLFIDDALRAKMDLEKILLDDVYATIAHIRQTGGQVFHPESGVHSGYCVVGKTTYWVGYTEDANAQFRLTEVYSHRMQIEQEKVWNGVKR
jgi:Fe-S oxidoreductase